MKRCSRVVDHRTPAEKLLQKRRTIRTINSGQSGNDTAFCAARIPPPHAEPCRSATRIRGAGLTDPRTVSLCVNARAAGEEDRRAWENVAKVTHSLQIDSAVIFRIATARTRAMNDDIELTAHGPRPRHRCVTSTARTGTALQKARATDSRSEQSTLQLPTRPSETAPR